MNPIFVFYHRKIVQQFDAVNWPSHLETKKAKRLCTRAVSGISLIRNESIYWFVNFSIKQYCIFF